MTSLLWLRDDLRLADHPALTACCSDPDDPVVAVWIHEGRGADGKGRPTGPRPLGAATRWWYHHSLRELSDRLAAIGIPLVFARGDSGEALQGLVDALRPRAVHWTRRYAPASCRLDASLKESLAPLTEVHSHPGSLLVEPWLTRPSGGGYYKVFTPFHRAAAELPVGNPLPEPKAVAAPPAEVTSTLAALRREGVLCGLDELGLLDDGPAWWESTLELHWTPGEQAALDRLAAVDSWLAGYSDTRNLPADPLATSALSPRLRCGELSPRQALQAVRQSTAAAADQAAWARQLYWREFCWHLLHHVEEIEWSPFRPEFADFPYEPDDELVKAWQTGTTGIDLVDAGMRQLWQSGWMHNRVRMVTASLLTKNLLQPWKTGEEWFWDTLVDADEANNPVSWQWVAGCGADPAPYFRVFNPELQSARFDPDGVYVTRWLGSGTRRTVPAVIDLAATRRQALAAYAQMRGRP
ncbi:MAG TPA: DNA photolyase family protein [Candidatus Luteococcus avicola]|nr:DNA photolyase family protein [Candidatus Luteococcus avicola]